jgi:hypothetical protein
MDLNLKCLFEYYFHIFNLQSLNKSQFYEIYYKIRNQINDKIKCWHIFDHIKEVSLFADKILEICNIIEEKLEYSRIWSINISSIRFDECDNYFTSPGFVKFNLEYAIKVSRDFRMHNFEDDAYLIMPLVEKTNYVWFNCPLEFYAGKSKKIIMIRYMNRCDQEQVTIEELHKLIKTY